MQQFPVQLRCCKNHGEGHHGFHGLFTGLAFKQNCQVSGGPLARAHHLPSNTEAVPFDLVVSSRINRHPRRNSDARGKYEVKPLLRYEKDISSFH